ncbi:hypothetical protein AYI69_g10283 [Smittium culicis]|uniref:Uncharacterized protein n=1 Tax=Smittium culicis TaxID=133412 RepID=A0A1R1X6U4_9FUNG|nr:hypothetical protein AYI69_g10283 [Smittium culicis]
MLPITRLVIRTITEPFGLHQDPPPSSGMGQIERDSCLCTSKRFANHGRIQGLVSNKHGLNLFQAFAAWVQGQFGEVVDHAISVDHPLRNGIQLQGNFPQGSIQQDPGSATRGQQTTECRPDDPKEFGELHWDSSINVDHSTSWKADATPTTRAQKPSSVNIEFIDIDSDSDETINPEPVILEESANVMERSLVLSRDAGNGDFYRRQRLSLWNRSWPPLLLWNMEPQGGKTLYQHEGTADSVVCTEAQECSRKMCVGLLRQHNHTSLCQVIPGHNLPRITGINREDLVLLTQDQHSPTGNIRAIRIKPSGRAQQTDSVKRMVYISGDILDAELAPWATRRSPEGPTRESHNTTSDSNVEIRNLAPIPDGAIDFTATASPRNNSGPRSEKRKVSALGKQELELDGLEDQRRFLETQGFGTYAIDLIVSNKSCVRRRSRPVMDISPVIKLLREWGQNSTLTTKQITPKLCWLLSVTGFLRANEIHRIDEQCIHIDQGVLNLVIVAPKEKRGDRPIEKPCQTNPQTDIIL